MKINVIIAAAGKGSRFGGKKAKQLIQLSKKPVLYYSIRIFNGMDDINEIVIVTNNAILRDIENIIEKYKFNKVKNIVLGGAERQNSIYEGLKQFNSEKESIVLIHDSVRPFINTELVSLVVKNSIAKGAAIPAIRVKDTIKFSEDGLFLRNTIERDKLWAIQTPQGFKYSIIMKAHQKAISDGFIGTDDASLLERMGIESIIVPGYEENLKITTPADLVLARAILKNFNK